MSESNFNHQHLGHVISREDVCLQCVQAKLREAQAACAAYEQCLKVIAYGEGKIEDKGEHYCNSLTDARTFATAQLEDYVDNPGAPLLARLEAADELAKASTRILRACASSVPGVFSNAQFILGEKLAAYGMTKEEK